MLKHDVVFIDFINQLEGWKTKCKNLHWSAPKKNIHEYLDDFLSIIQDYQDGLAEEYMGICNKKIGPNVIKGISCDCMDAMEFIDEVRSKTVEFYTNIPQDIIFEGISSECENFIHNINKYKYLYSLTDY